MCSPGFVKSPLVAYWTFYTNTVFSVSPSVLSIGTHNILQGSLELTVFLRLALNYQSLCLILPGSVIFFLHLRKINLLEKFIKVKEKLWKGQSIYSPCTQFPQSLISHARIGFLLSWNLISILIHWFESIFYLDCLRFIKYTFSISRFHLGHHVNIQKFHNLRFFFAWQFLTFSWF